ncbi:MAG: HAMP domain-containing sensor histidine kinase [Gemmataceae bacterium]
MTAPPFPFWRHFGRLAPLAVLWIALVGWLAWLLYSRTTWTDRSDEQDMREWLNETRVFRKSLPELIAEYVELTSQGDAERVRVKYDEIETHLAALAEPTRKYSGKLPLFPELYRIGVSFDGPIPAGRLAHPAWVSPMPRPGGAEAQARVRVVESVAAGGRARVQCEYRIHTNHRFEEEERARRYWQIPLVAFLVPATGVAGFIAFRTLRRERQRELDQIEAERSAEHRERELLQTRMEAESRAAEAERSALELKSQLYASIGIMAGSYAHNIKNLLVRPNDLLARCLDNAAGSSEQHAMLEEVKSTLATVTERLQQILRTVRRDPTRADMTKLDLAALVRESHHTWADTAWDKWKLRIQADVPTEPMFISGDHSHLQQAVENLIFNARDATFEMRNVLREEARHAADPEKRKQRLLESAAWKGEVSLRVKRDGPHAILEIADNGIGMSDEVRANCLKTHFTTKRDNALYEGYSAGMGLGLSFVAVVLEHHGAKLEIDSQPRRGAVFRIRFETAA